PVREAAHATTATVGPAGGTIVATAATGTTYTLTIPRGALRTPTPITLTPVTALSGLAPPLDLVAAVQGAPAGPPFALPAPLTVVEERSAGPELGADALRSGALAPWSASSASTPAKSVTLTRS
ncbi:MAG: hypothetical protein J5W83_17190, partial [Candidatus Accumulibacter sp.]|nr:hypothetical protein [Accumulibacter sp.]